jgi:gamma-glutamyl hydrolase
LTPEDLNQTGLNKSFRIISTNQDDNGTQFISAYESIEHPIYATQFHPEMNAFEFALTNTVHRIPHSINAIKIAQYFANFFVNQARNNCHKFANRKLESDSLIFNYHTVYTGKSEKASFEQIYRFDITGNAAKRQQTHFYEWCVTFFIITFISSYI